MAILAAFALVYAEHHALGINIADLQRDHLHGSQTRALGNAERRFVFGPRRSLQQTQHLFGREHARQLARLVNEHDMSRRFRPVERHFEEEPERGHSRVDGRWLHTGLGQMQLERAQLFRRRGVGGTAEESREPLDGTDVLALRIGHEPAHAHVFEHALAPTLDQIVTALDAIRPTARPAPSRESGFVLWGKTGPSSDTPRGLSLPSRPGEFHPEPLTDPDL